MWLSINLSITRTYSLIHSIDRQLVNETKNELYKQAAVLTVDCYYKRINTLIPTFLKLKFVNLGRPRSHASESNAELAISATKIISIMLAPIPVIHETHWYVNSLCPFFPFAQWTLWRTLMIHRLFFHSFYWIKTDRRRQDFSGLYTFFIRTIPFYALIYIFNSLHVSSTSCSSSGDTNCVNTTSGSCRWPCRV